VTTEDTEALYLNN